MKRAIALTERDNVATMLEEVKRGEDVEIMIGERKIIIKAEDSIPFGHKIALKDFRRGEKVIKYGEVIGHASKDIDIGKHVHIHNVKSNRMQLPDVWYRKEG